MTINSPIPAGPCSATGLFCCFVISLRETSVCCSLFAYLFSVHLKPPKVWPCGPCPLTDCSCLWIQPGSLSQASNPQSCHKEEPFSVYLVSVFTLHVLGQNIYSLLPGVIGKMILKIDPASAASRENQYLDNTKAK